MGWRSSVHTVEVHGSLDRERKGLSTRVYISIYACVVWCLCSRESSCVFSSL